MESIFSFVVGLLTAALSLLGFVQQHPELPPASRDQAQQIAQQAINQANQALINAQTESNQTSNNRLSVTPTAGAAPLLVNFIGGANGTSIDFGDGSSGTFTFTECKPGGKCDPVASHRYPSPGTYIAVLSGSGARVTIKVDNSGSVQSGTLRMVMSGHENQPLLIRFELSTAQSRSYSLDFGDGTPVATLPTGCAGPTHICATEHTYAAPGIYVATLKMDGAQIATATVTAGK